jgi:hypothetical protein
MGLRRGDNRPAGCRLAIRDTDRIELAPSQKGALRLAPTFSVDELARLR